MSEKIVTKEVEPDIIDTYQVDEYGRICIGREYAGESVVAALELDD